MTLSREYIPQLPDNFPAIQSQPLMQSAISVAHRATSPDQKMQGLNGKHVASPCRYYWSEFICHWVILIIYIFFSPQTGHWKAGVPYACRDCCWLLSPLQVRKDGHQSCSDARVTNQAQGSCWAANTRPQEICQAGFQHTHIRDFPGLTLELNIALGCLDG